MNPFMNNDAAFDETEPSHAEEVPKETTTSSGTSGFVGTQYPHALITELLSMGFQNSEMLMNGTALMAYEFALRTLALELSCRCAQVARDEYGESIVDIKQLEKVLPQFLLDLR